MTAQERASALRVYLVAEGPCHVEFLAKLLPDARRAGAKFVDGKGKSSARSLARSLVAARHEPVALVLDADTTEEHLVREQRLITREFLRMASPGVPTEVRLAVPSIEIVFFADRALLSRIVGVKVPDDEWISGQFQPKKTLETLLSRAPVPSDYRQFLARLNETDAARLAQHPFIREIQDFIEQATRSRVAETG